MLQAGFPIAQRTIARIKGPVAMALGSAPGHGILDDLLRTGAAIISASAVDDLARMKAACRGKVTVLGNLNGIEMRRWTPEQAAAEVKAAIAKDGAGGGFILADNHGEISWQVSEDVLLAISEAVRERGRYPLRWTDERVG